MSDETIWVDAPRWQIRPAAKKPQFFELPGGKINALRFGTVAQIAIDNLSTTDARHLMTVIVDALNRDHDERSPATPEAAP